MGILVDSQQEFIQKISLINPALDLKLLAHAYELGAKSHEGQLRASGEPYFSHPIQVAYILASMHLDTATVITGLLHDVVEDTHITIEEIGKIYGEEVAFLVGGVTKLSKIKLYSEQLHQVESFRKLFLAIAHDMRVLLVKLADRLHNIQTLKYLPVKEKRQRIARETIEIYAALAERIGIETIKDELEDLCFEELYPQERKVIIEKLNHFMGTIATEDIVKELQELLAKYGIKGEVSGRVKTPYSIFKKMQAKGVQFEELYDLIAFRTLVDSVGECYHVLGILHSTYPVIPGRFKDYISIPKANRYQSLHTSVIGPFAHRIEIQIRTHEMHAISEYGLAAHWRYKGGYKKDRKEEYPWLNRLINIVQNTEAVEDVMEHTRLEIFDDKVFCFSPKGDLIRLPSGATPIDFAYAIHSDLGDHCAGAKINGRFKSLFTALNHGDQVEIIITKNQTPFPMWENFVATGKAKACIRRFIRNQQKIEYIALGKAMLKKAMERCHVSSSEKNIKKLLPQTKQNKIEEFLISVSQGQYSLDDLIASVFSVELEGHIPDEGEEFKKLEKPKSKPVKKRSTKPVEDINVLESIPNMLIRFARCCHPIAGDETVGVITTGKGLTIHVVSCKSLEQVDPQRMISLDLPELQEAGYVCRLHVIMLRENSSMALISNVVESKNCRVEHLKIVHRTDRFFDCLLDVGISGKESLSNLLAALRNLSTICLVERI